jgi:hypothetical protein
MFEKKILAAHADAGVFDFCSATIVEYPMCIPCVQVSAEFLAAFETNQLAI